MKALVRKESNIALYLFSDSETVAVAGDKTVIGDPATLIIADCTTENTTLFEGVDEPSEWTGCKYLYTADGGWELNPDYVAPEDPAE
jgi:hypothetical protein